MERNFTIDQLRDWKIAKAHLEMVCQPYWGEFEKYEDVSKPVNEFIAMMDDKLG